MGLIRILSPYMEGALWTMDTPHLNADGASSENILKTYLLLSPPPPALNGGIFWTI